ncbi:MAG: peptide chain release factor 1 [Planctomycetes bacterium]|nr:peptide chain release factor 1 [Planctomycetota bacterium]
MQFAPAILEKLAKEARRYAELTEQISQPDFASDPKKLMPLLRERGDLERYHALHERLTEAIRRREEAEKLLGDADYAELAREELAALEIEEPQLDAEVKRALVTDEDDRRSKVIVEIRAGTGGEEAALFAADLYRIYTKFFDAQGWRQEVFDVSPSEMGGYREVVFAVEGEGAWAKLRFESGGHRVQRVPETEAQGRIHTSAATVAVLPEAEEVDVQIKPDELRIDTMRAGGAGGQHVNKTESAVRITHLPTNTVVVCQDEKSQHKNKARAMRMLRARLFEAQREKLHAERSALRKSMVGSGDRSERVRTYNWPQNRVTDHRLGENFSLEQILAGKLGPIVDGLVEQDLAERLKQL